MSTLTNTSINARSMNGLITISDGAGTTIENGTIDTDLLEVEQLNATSFTTNAMIANSLQILRTSTPAVNTLLGTVIDIGKVLNNFNFDPANRFVSVYADTANNMIDIDLSGNGIAIYPKNLSIFPLLNSNFVCPNITFTNSGVSFPNSTVTFNSYLPTSTLTPTLSTELITKGFADSAYQATGTAATLGGANAFTNTNTITAPSIPVTINNWNFATPARPINTAQNQTAPYTAITGWTITAVVGTPFAVAINNGFATYINTYQTLYPDYPAVTQALSISQNTVPNTLRVQQSIAFAETGNYQLTFWIWGMYNTYRTTQSVTASINSYSAVFRGVEQLWTKCLLRFNISLVGSYPLVFDFINTFSNSVLSITSVKIEKQT